MAVNRTGVILLLTSTTGFAASLWLIWPSRHEARHGAPAPRPSAPTAVKSAASGAANDAKIQPSSKEHGALCDDLAARDRAKVETASMSCARDEDCVAEERGGIYLTLDGCGRFTKRGASLKDADQIAQSWLADACSWAPDVTASCGAVYAQCKNMHCVERAPDPLPRDWKRLSLRATASVFAPTDFVETDVRGDDSLVRVFEGKDRSIELSLDPYADGTVDPSLHPKSELVDGELAQVYSVDHHEPGPRRFERGVVFQRHFTGFFLGGGYLSLRLYCATDKACADKESDAILRSLRVLLESVEIPARDK